ncbi:hypothetical protein JD844_016284 [Phrynosoma platyrhinos]|uniref:Coiled-coil domain-containing protein 178 n=1 Tax=Phrynosoma platyrhinos TaxID=52577 RepID=A0ABQ7SK56_PHRPL|nr:hypothetical protein JD844_016284 [Phrynosoma platyrhinos]
MTDLHLLSSSFKNNSQQPEGINEKISLGIPSRQRSCAAVNTPSACVNKAIHHIQDLEVKVEEAFQWVVYLNVFIVLVIIFLPIKYDHLYQLEKIPRDTDIKSVEEARWLSASSEWKAEPSFYLEAIQPLKQKTAAVLAEATELVTRLENERKEAEEALEFERRRRKKLYQHADYLSLWRLQQLPIAVQKEWEKHSQDVAELQWHFEEKNQQLQDAVNQLTKIDSANAKIQEHIDFMKKYSPLLGEKLSFECDSIEEVKQKYKKTKSVYDIVHEKLVNVKAINEELTVECEQKRKSMSEHIQSAEDMLNLLMKQMKDAEIFYADLCAKINEKKEAILQHKKRLEELIKQEADTKADLLSWQDKVRRLNLKIEEQENENKILLNEYLEEMQNMESSKTTQDSDIQNLKDKFMSYLEEITRLQDESKRLHDENGEFLQKFRESSRRKVGYQTEIQVLRKNIRRLEDHLKRVNIELYKNDLAYDEAKSKLEELSQSIAKDKMRFKNLEENVKKQIKDEVSAWKLTQKRVRALKADLIKRQKEHAKLKEKIQQKLAELNRLVAEQTELLEKNKEKQKNLTQEIASLKQKIKELDEKEKKINEELEDQKKCFQNLLNYIQEKYLDISNQLAKVNEDIAKYQKEITKLSTLNKGTQNQVDITQRTIEELR